jgi:mycothiol synthase
VSLTRRTALPSDAAAVARLYVAYDTVELGAPEMELGDVEQQLTLAGSERIVVEDGDRLVGFADVARTGEAETVVDPAYAGAGELQRELLTWVTERARDLGARRLEHWAGPSPGGAALVLAAAGFAHVRTMWQMRRELAAALPATVWPAGVRQVAFDPAEHGRATWELMTRAFAGQFGSHARPFADWAHFVLVPETDAVLAFDGDVLVGAAVTGPRGGGGHVNQLAVMPESRGRGLAKALLHEAFRRDTESGHSATTLVVDGDNDTARSLYEKAGMRVEREYRRWERDV